MVATANCGTPPATIVFGGCSAVVSWANDKVPHVATRVIAVSFPIFHALNLNTLIPPADSSGLFRFPESELPR